MADWISVKDRLPEDDQDYLCWYGFGKNGVPEGMMFMGCLTYFSTDPQPHWQHEGIGLCVTHYMPLPEPPKEENT